MPDGTRWIQGNYQRIAEHTAELQSFSPEVVVDMIPITEQNAHDVLAVFRGVARRIVAISSQDVYRAWGVVHGVEAAPADPVLNEEAPLRQSLYLYRGKPIKIYDWDFENYDKVLVERAFQSDPTSSATVLRLPMVYGPGDPGHRMYGYVKRMDDGRPAIPLEASAAAWRGPLGYVEDVGAAIALAAMNESAAGRVYNVAELDVRSIADWVREMAEATGWKGQVVTVPDGTLSGPWSTLHLGQHCLTDTRRIREELGYRETLPRMEAVRRTIEWERAHPPEGFTVDYSAEDRALAALAATSGPA
jgi:nucleoside-diphosphate-sugar epimerase